MVENKKQKHQLFLGNLVKKEGKEGKKVFYSGYFGNVPIVGFVGIDEPNKIHIVLDVDRANYKQEHGDEKKEKVEAKTEQPI